MVRVQVFALFFYLIASIYLSEINLHRDLLPNKTHFRKLFSCKNISRPENRKKLHWKPISNSTFNIMCRTVPCTSIT